MTESDLDLSDNDSNDGPSNSFDAREFIEKQLELLDIENEVNTEVTEEQARMSREQLVQSGTTIDSLRIDGLPSTSGSFGETIVKFVPNDSQKMSSLSQSKLKKGDIVGIIEQSKWPSRASSRSSFKSRNRKERKTGHAQKSNDAHAQSESKDCDKDHMKPIVSGTIVSVSKRSVTVSFDESLVKDVIELDQDTVYLMIQQVDDVTHKRTVQALISLKEGKSPSISQDLRDVLLFQKPPISDGTSGLSQRSESCDSGVSSGGSFESIKLSGSESTKNCGLNLFNTNLDETQVEAIKCSLSSRSPVAVIHGPPGTGKTTTLVEIILQAVLVRRLKVLICAPSNLAVDNLLEKVTNELRNRECPQIHSIVRLGNPSRIRNELSQYTILSRIQNGANGERIRRLRRQIQNMIHGSSSGSNNHYFQATSNNQTTFDRQEDSFGHLLASKDFRSKSGHCDQNLGQSRPKSVGSLIKELQALKGRETAKVLLDSNLIFGTLVGSSPKSVLGVLVKEVERAEQSEKEMEQTEKKSEQSEQGAMEKSEQMTKLEESRRGKSSESTKSSESIKRNAKAKLFDLIIIDECAQGTEAQCWIPLPLARRCILAGDHFQLPPTIQSQKASNQGLQVTLMERLDKSPLIENETIMRMLQVQYRSNQLIMDWSSSAFYDRKLKGHSSVRATKLLDLYPDIDAKMYPPLLLVDTCDCDMNEGSKSSKSIKGDGIKSCDLVSSRTSKVNIHEVELVIMYVQDLIQQGINPESIGIISPYNQQVDAIKNFLKQGPDKGRYQNWLKSSRTGLTFDEVKERMKQVEVNSVDGYQGREKEVILISLVRSNENHAIGFLSEKRRLNVAVTRAKRHVVLFCDTKTMARDEWITSLVDHFRAKGLHRLGTTFKQSPGLLSNFELDIEHALQAARKEMGMTV